MNEVEILRFALLGLGLGGIYALAAQGMVLVYRGSGVLNFAHGGFALIGAYAFVDLRETGWPAGIALPASVALAAVTGALTHVVIMRPLRNSAPLTRLIASLALMIVIQEAAKRQYGEAQEFVTSLLPTDVVEPVSGAPVSIDRLILLGIAVVSTAALWVAYRYSKFGIATTAVAENEQAAASAGWSPDVMATLNWSFGAALAGLAGILLVPILGLSVNQLILLVIPAMAAGLVGGFSSFPLTLVAALAMGIAESEMARYVSAPGWGSSVPFLVIVGVLVVRGHPLPTRGQLAERLPKLGPREPRWGFGITLAAIGVLGAVGLATTWVDALTTTLIFALIGLSLVVVTGFTGQLSLAQYAFAGVGAFAAGRLADVFDIPFLLSLGVGVAAAIPAGILIGLPALRTRGTSLAVATLGLSLAVERLLLGNPDYTGGLEGTVVKAPSLFGTNVDSIEHPARYALVCLALLGLAAIVVLNLRRSHIGRRLIAVRTNERAAAALGISVYGAKLYAFAVSAGIAGLAGVLLAFRARNVVFGQFNIFASINAVLITVIGGVGYLVGALIGALLAVGGLVARLTDDLFGGGSAADFVPLISGVVVLVVLIVLPDGVARLVARAGPRLRRIVVGRRIGCVGLMPEGEAVHRGSPGTLDVRDLTVRFGGVLALSDVSLSVEPGEVVGLIGPNGAGKTTLIDAVTGFARGYRGRVTLNGTVLDRWSARRRARAGLGRSFQSLELFEDVTVRENLQTASDPRDLLGYLVALVWPRRTHLGAAALAAARTFELGGDLDRCPCDLSFGKRRLVAIARAIAAEPSVLLLDEPAAGLDDHERAELGDLIRRLAREWGIAILLVEHDVSMVFSICDRVVVIDFGTKIAEGTPAEIRDDDRVVTAYLGAGDEAHVARAEPMALDANPG